jgi:hypothetical protein
MAEGIRVDAITHRCVLHDDQRVTVCSGTLKKGGNCTNRASNTPASGMMPTCGIHRNQLKVSGWCRAPLPCGFSCGRIFEWKPHGFPLCPDHRRDLATCFFLKMPQEIRLRVYQFLLPDGPIPAQYQNSRSLTTDGEGVDTAILRVNRLIHDEAVDLLYSTRPFIVELCGDDLRMCNLFGPLRCTDAVQDYQMQLMLLEQQNKRRLIIARLGDDLSGWSSSTHTPIIRGIQEPIDTPWRSPISDRCFNMIRSFVIKIVFSSALNLYFAKRRTPGPSNANAVVHEFLEVSLYDYCDHLHRLVKRLRLIQRPIARLGIIIKFGNTYAKREEAFSATQVLLRPLRRLYNVATPKVLSITMDNSEGYETELLTPDWISCTADKTFADYLECWSRDLSGARPSCECPQVFKAYLKLGEFMSNIKEHCSDAERIFSQLAGLLHAARVAREAEDLMHFKEIWDQVVNIWLDYLKERNNLHSNVTRSMDAIYDIVGNSSEASGSERGRGS